MGPERVNLKSRRSQSSSREHRSHKKHGNRKNQTDIPGAEVPGVQKLKAALRQTRRLLAKENLAPDVRRETERRLRSLESDLQSAELKRRERSMAKRYHKVKFFERTKVLRKIKKVKGELEQGEAASSKEAATQLENTLFELRAQLNYILNYPKLEKYVSLFPPSKEKDEQNPDLGDATQPVRNESDARRKEFLTIIKHKMVAGELSGDPELEVEQDAPGASARATSAGRATKFETCMQKKPGTSGARSSLARPKGQSKMTARQEIDNTQKAENVGDDDFFDAMSGSASDSGSDSTDDNL